MNSTCSIERFEILDNQQPRSSFNCGDRTTVNSDKREKDMLLPLLENSNLAQTCSTSVRVHRWAVQTLGKALPSFCQLQDPSTLKRVSSNSVSFGAWDEKNNPGTETFSRDECIRHLDGLRGIACLAIFNFHFLCPWTYTAMHGYGADYNNAYVHQLPLLCLFIRGRAMVTLLFAISGYVLSYKFLKHTWQTDLMRDGRLLRSLSSSIFRRGVHLFGPPIFCMLIVAIVLPFGVFEPGYRIQHGERDGTYWLSGFREQHPIKRDTLTAQMWDFITMLGDWANLWTWDLYCSHYGPHTWTTPLEFRSSLILSTVWLATYRLRRAWRMTAVTGLVAYCLSWARWEVALFLGGMLLAEVDLIRSENAPNEIVLQRSESIKSAAPSATAVFVGLYLLSFPDLDAQTTPGYALLARWTPKFYKLDYLYWQSLGSLITLWGINDAPCLRSLLKSDVCQYLGKISFALYLVHGPLLRSFGLVMMPVIWSYTGRISNAGSVSGLLIGWAIMMAFAIWVADLFWRLVDIPCRRLARALETSLNAPYNEL